MKPSRIAQIGIPAAIVGVVIMMVVPLPTQLLDVLLAFNMGFSVLILLVAMRVTKPLDFSIFPALLLLATLFRLALNIASTRLVLLQGDAGQVIESFGHFVVGGSIVVGLVIFVILMIIQFVVITNGAGRVAEVAARFTLDALPGKQMAVDADLNSGLIDENEARRRRKEVSAEADFYGAMDGASKFVKGDAIASVIITLINLLGGFAIGMLQNGLSAGESIQKYSLLSVGDGLVSQIPALLLSVSTGLIVTRATTENDLGTDLLAQFGRHRQAVMIAGAAVLALGLVPGLPKLPFILIGAILLALAFRLPKEGAEVEPEEIPEDLPTTPQKDSPMAIAQDMRVEPLELELAYDLIDLVDSAAGGDLLDRVRALRRKLAQEIGIVVPLVRTRDNLDLPPRHYAIRVHGVEVARGQAPAGMVLAIGDDLDQLPGMVTQEPVFGLAAKWVPAELREHVALASSTVVDRSSVITTHMAEVVRVHAAQLLSREDVKMLVDMVRQSHPVVVDELTPAPLSLGEVQRALQGLLTERVCIRDLVRIFEAMSMRAKVSTDPDGLVESARGALGPAIAASHAVDGRLSVITFEPLLEQRLMESLRPSEQGVFLAMDPLLAERLATEAGRVAALAEANGDPPVLVCAGPLRLPIRRLLEQAAPRTPVLSYAELGGQLTLVTSGVVNVAEVTAA
ncbi:flagellar biosynthesis protein FlhA [Kineosphaera limosa]|uniref:Flagellar biosynthesis protein FlhA n=1 Tax=Kineosphaera limosa NBRC 100340 TaxID=1184609 RepID=K6W9L7_9MICO|nr:flagellar biosynthesis protein FlhA [Kineosphaera limosa]NYD99784.1 flagellar biosynthesis protein FlhA [Kineosphaera limosa]GAB95885.1 putative flagellar biosynthesis protein FlhA [Kineosphaera limosa NBRC 100340]